MQQEFYIGQKVKTSQIGIEKGCSEMVGTIVSVKKWLGEVAYYVEYDGDSTIPEGLFLPEEIEPLEDSSVSKVVFDKIASILQ